MRADTIIPAMWILIFVLGVWCGFMVGLVVGRWFPSRQNMGEALVANTISAGLQRRHLLLNNVTLQTGEKTSQIDHILVTETGIFVIETKHYTGWIFGDERGDQWTQVIYRKKSRFQNPVRQNYGHVKALQALFDLPVGAFESLVVFTGDAEFKTDLGPTVLKLSELAGHLDAERPVLFDERKMTYIVGRIEMKRLRRSIETDEYHLNYVCARVKGFN
jgi:restriction system protein